MSVDIDTATAGTDTTTVTPTRRSRAKPPPAPPRPVVLVCERCDQRVRGSGAGFAAVDLREASMAALGRLHAGDKARWRVLHHRCAPEVTRPLNPYFRVWVERMGTVDDLLDTVAELSRLPWFAHSDWGGLVRRCMADTGKATEPSDELRTRRAGPARRQAARRRDRRLADDDPRHGSVNAYINWGCRCDRCCQANTDATRNRRKALSAPQTNQREPSA